MKNILSCTKTALILLVATIILLVASVYMIVRPISYGFGYHNETVYENTVFKGTIKFYPDGTMSVGNANFDEEMMFRYYYKDGYVFSTVAETEEEYEEEVAYINSNFEEAVNAPFYACEINAFTQVSVGVDGYTMVYTCTGAIVFAVVACIVDLILIGLTCVSFVLCKKQKN